MTTLYAQALSPVGVPGETAAAAADDLIRAREGDREAFVRLLRRHQARVHALALRLTGRREDAEELAQDVFLQLSRSLARIEDAAHLKHWLLRAATHRAIDRLRRDGFTRRCLSLDATSDPPADEAAQDPLAQRHLRALLLQLAPDARAVVVLRYQEDLDPLDIARLLDMPANTVKSHLRRSLEFLRTSYPGAADGN